MASPTKNLHVMVAVVTVLALCLALPVPASLTVDVASDSGTLELVYMDESSQVTMNYSYPDPSAPPLLVKFATTDDSKAVVSANDTLVLLAGSQGTVTFTLQGRIIGRTELQVLVNDSAAGNASDTVPAVSGQTWFLHRAFPLVVSRHDRAINTVFNVGVILLVILANLSMGCRIEADVIKATMKRPIAPAIGFLSQFLVMPLLSFALAYLLQLEPAVALGFLTMGSCPGGSGSNFWTFLLHGDVSLSVTMTFISTLASFGMLPLWLYTLGTMVLYKGQGLVIPFENIFTSLLALVVPVTIGFLVKWKKPQWSKYLERILKPVVVLFILFILTVGVYANLYVFRLIEPLLVVAGALLPYLGFLLGGLIAIATRRNKSHVITIAIETGIQNTGIAIVLLLFSLKPPESDIAIVSPIIAAIFTPIPIAIAVIVLAIRKRFCVKGHELKGKDEDMDAEDKEPRLQLAKASDKDNGKVFHLTMEDATSSTESDNAKI